MDKYIANATPNNYNGKGDKMIVYKNEKYIVCRKITGVSSQRTHEGRDMPHLISEHLKTDVNNIYPIPFAIKESRRPVG